MIDQLSTKDRAQLDAKYRKLEKELQVGERIFLDVGQPDTLQGFGWFREPRLVDGLPMLQVYAITGRTEAKKQQRINDIKSNGWIEYKPAPAVLKKV